MFAMCSNYAQPDDSAITGMYTPRCKPGAHFPHTCSRPLYHPDVVGIQLRHDILNVHTSQAFAMNLPMPFGPC